MVYGPDFVDDLGHLAAALRSAGKTFGLLDELPSSYDEIVDHLSLAVVNFGIGRVLKVFYENLPSEPESYKVIDRWRNESSLPRLDILRALLKKGNTAIKPWLRAAARAERMTCGISDDTSYLGTGFLIGDDLVLTASHILEQANTATVTLTFDQITFFGCVIDPGMSVGLAASWNASDSAELEMLDIIVLRTRSSVGNQVIGASTEKRSWFALPTIATLSIAPQDVVTLVHRPAAASYFVSFGNYDRDAGSGKSFFYDANPRPGSSGSPVVASQNWDVLGVHVGENSMEPQPNFEAISSVIIRTILEQEKKLKLDPPPVSISQA